jgi:predicted O-methyltransferase YrrM
MPRISEPPSRGVLGDPDLERLLETLHARSDAQGEEMAQFEAQRAQPASAGASREAVKTFYGDKLVALDRDKAEFCYLLCRTVAAQRVVEIGTSYGVSTL